MKNVDLHQIELMAKEIAASLDKRVQCSYQHEGQVNTLLLRSGINGTADVSFTTIEPGTLFLELSSGKRTDWLFSNESDLEQLFSELRLMLEALFLGRVSHKGVFYVDDHKFRLTGPNRSLFASWKHYQSYPNIEQ